MQDLSIADMGRALRAGSTTSRRLTEQALGRIAAQDALINSFITVTTERALADADAADADFAAGIDQGPMQGIPYALKDIYMTAGIRSTCHSKLMVDHVPAEDCFIEARFKAGGAVLIGKNATHEFAIGGPSFDLPFPPARNPWNPLHIPGGSSSGSGAAVAAGFVRLSMGSDTGGSIRFPAAYCGTVGLKPSYGLLSRRGIHPLSFTLDHAGPLSWTVEDSALAMQVITAFDPLDPASADPGPIDFIAPLHQGVAGLKFALPRHFFERAAGVSDEVIASIDASVAVLRGLGALVDVVTLPDYELFNATGRIILLAEAYAVHEKNLRLRPLDYGRYTHSRMLVGGMLAASDLVQALRARRKLAQVVNNTVLGRYDAILTASALTPAVAFDTIDPGMPPAFGIQTIPFNVTGNPALALPIGFSASGLPLSLQIVGRPFADAQVLRMAQALEDALALRDRRPALCAAGAAATATPAPMPATPTARAA